MSAATGSPSDTVFLAGHRFWKVQCDYLGADFSKKVHEADMGAWTVAAVPVDHSKSQWQEYAPGQIHYADVVLTAHLDPKSSAEAQTKFTQQVLGTGDSKYRFNFTIQFTDSKPNVLLTYDFQDCMVVNWQLGGGDAHDRGETYKQVVTIRPTFCKVS
jgi:hypothetical protein